MRITVAERMISSQLIGAKNDQDTGKDDDDPEKPL